MVRHEVHNEQLEDEESRGESDDFEFRGKRGNDSQFTTLPLAVPIEFVAVAARACTLQCAVYGEVAVEGEEDATEEEEAVHCVSRMSKDVVTVLHGTYLLKQLIIVVRGQLRGGWEGSRGGREQAEGCRSTTLGGKGIVL